MKKLLLIVIGAVLLTTIQVGSSQERIDFPAPVVVTRTASLFESLCMNWATSEIEILLRDNTGVPERHDYTGATADTMLRAFNTLPSGRSLKQRILDRLKADGKISGTVAGAVP